MVTLIVSIIFLGLIFWAVSLIQLPEPFPTIIRVLFIVVAVIMILNAFGLDIGVPTLR